MNVVVVISLMLSGAVDTTSTGAIARANARLLDEAGLLLGRGQHSPALERLIDVDERDRRLDRERFLWLRGRGHCGIGSDALCLRDLAAARQQRSSRPGALPDTSLNVELATVARRLGQFDICVSVLDEILGVVNDDVALLLAVCLRATAVPAGRSAAPHGDAEAGSRRSGPLRAGPAGRSAAPHGDAEAGSRRSGPLRAGPARAHDVLAGRATSAIQALRARMLLEDGAARVARDDIAAVAGVLPLAELDAFASAVAPVDPSFAALLGELAVARFPADAQATSLLRRTAKTTTWGLQLEPSEASAVERLRDRLAQLVDAGAWERVRALHPRVRAAGYFDDDDVRYALAFALFSTGDLRGAEAVLDGALQLERTIALRSALHACELAEDRCPR
ncbi:MAG: hypothetical protein Q8O67_29405 [Deltaproteobacteria bacterium]|nr:hypothetical protein [Deltaproteobacteria bacterium]